MVAAHHRIAFTRTRMKSMMMMIVVDLVFGRAGNHHDK